MQRYLKVFFLFFSVFVFGFIVSNSLWASSFPPEFNPPILFSNPGAEGDPDPDITRDPDVSAVSVLPDGGTFEIFANETVAPLSPGEDRKWGTEDDVLYEYFTFGENESDTKVPGPFIRVLEGNEVTIKLVNNGTTVHSIDFHAVTGFQGGATELRALSGETAEFTFTADVPGIYIYHCVGDGSPMDIARHPHNGMMGMMLVEPKKGNFRKALDKADKEYFVLKHSMFVDKEATTNEGAATFDAEKLIKSGVTDYCVYQGRMDALIDHPLVSSKDDNVMLYYGNMGMVSHFHIIGEIFDNVWQLGDLKSRPLKNIQTVDVPTASALAVGFKTDVKSDSLGKDNGIHILVDHDMKCFMKGSIGIMVVE